MIDAHALTKRFGARTAVDALTFAVERGETVGFLGPNGAGKSTTMRLLTGFIAPSAGTVRVAGHDIEAEPLAARRSIGYLPESNPLYRDMRVHEFLRFRARLKRLPRARRVAAVEESLERCRVADVRDRIIGQLSKGYRQRVGLADALLGKPPLLILDEPTVGLDPNQVVETRRLIRDIGRECTVFLSTHILHEVEFLCPRVLIIDRGRLVAEGAAADLARRHARERVLYVECYPAVASTDRNKTTAVDPARFGQDAARAFRGIPGVKHVAVLDPTPEGASAFRITATNRDTGPEDQAGELRRATAALAQTQGWLIQEMRLEPLRLEELFAHLTGHGRTAEATAKT